MASLSALSLAPVGASMRPHSVPVRSAAAAAPARRGAGAGAVAAAARERAVFTGSSSVSIRARRKAKPGGKDKAGQGVAGQPVVRAVSSAGAGAIQPFVMTGEGTLMVPLNYYACLGASKSGDLRDAEDVQAACDARLADPPKDGFGEQALLCRAHLLRAAATCLMDDKSRTRYDERLLHNDPVVEVPLTEIPGTLALLQEIGELEAVVETGALYLNKYAEAGPLHARRDVALAMALAYCDLSREAMDATPRQATRACDCLEAALKLLRDYEVNFMMSGDMLAARLQADIELTLQDLAPSVVMEVLAAPITPATEPARTEAIAALKMLLWEPAGEDDPNSFAARAARAELMRLVYPLLTAAEQARINSEAPANIPAEPKEVYNAALAHVAAGFSAGNPTLVAMADELLEQLHEAQEGLQDKQDVSVERGMVSLLLGDVDRSVELLGLESPTGDEGIRSFVASHTGDDGDMLAGMCMLLERWMQEAVLPQFCDTRARAHLTNINQSWFEDTAVQRKLEALDKKDSLVSSMVSMFTGGQAKAKASSAAEAPPPPPPPTRRRPETAASVPPTPPPTSPVQDEPMEPLLTSPTNRSLLSISAALIGVAGVSAAVVGLRHAGASRLPASARTATAAPVRNNARGGVAATATAKPKPLDTDTAKELVEKWQRIKAQALGGKHNVALLGDILDGYMLSQWKARAQDVKQHGWYWEYTLVGLKVDSVSMAENNTKAFVQATLQEAAQLYDRGRPDNNDAYRSTYCARYELSWKPSVGWRITSGAVLY